MKIIKTKFKDLLVIREKEHYDKRGFFKEIYKKNAIKEKFIFECISYSKKNVIRGLHYQYKSTQAHLVTIISGKIFDVALDLRKNSKTFGKYLLQRYLNQKILPFSFQGDLLMVFAL